MVKLQQVDDSSNFQTSSGCEHVGSVECKKIKNVQIKTEMSLAPHGISQNWWSTFCSWSATSLHITTRSGNVLCGYMDYHAATCEAETRWQSG